MSQFAGICSFDFDGTIDKNSKGAADFCRSKNFAVVGLSAGGHALESDWVPNIGKPDYHGKDATDGNQKGKYLAMLLATEPRLKGISYSNVIHFDDSEGCNKDPAACFTKCQGKTWTSCPKETPQVGEINGSVLTYPGMCIFQSGKSRIDSGMAQFAFANKNKAVEHSISYPVNQLPTPLLAGEQAPFLRCSQPTELSHFAPFTRQVTTDFQRWINIVSQKQFLY